MKTDILLDALGGIEDEIILDAKKATPPKKRLSQKRIIVFAAALLLALSLPALAVATVDPAYQMMYRLSPTLAQVLKPIRMSCMDQGIKMEVLSASIYENEAAIVISMQDTEGERIDQTTDLFDSYRIYRSFDCSATCDRLGFDTESRTATFLIRITQWEDRPIEGDKITFSVREFLSRKQTFEGEITEIDLSTADRVSDTRTGVPFVGADIADRQDLNDEEALSAIDSLREKTWMLPQTDSLCSPVDGVSITAIGYIEGKLHIQILYQDNLETDNHGSVHLVDRNGQKHYSDYSISFFEKDGGGRYDEQVFDIPPDEIGQYQLHGRFVTSPPAIEGNWQVTFPLEDTMS